MRVPGVPLSPASQPPPDALLVIELGDEIFSSW
jgi:hypothetical protein